jgi:hypothetical protein
MPLLLPHVPTTVFVATYSGCPCTTAIPAKRKKMSDNRGSRRKKTILEKIEQNGRCDM